MGGGECMDLQREQIGIKMLNEKGIIYSDVC